MITREQVADLRDGDVVDLIVRHRDEFVLSALGPLRSIASHALFLGEYCVRRDNGDPVYGEQRSLTVVSRAPRPLYVNHPRTEVSVGDVVADDDGREPTVFFCADPMHEQAWLRGDERRSQYTWLTRSELPTRLRLLVDGETGRVVL